MSEILSVGKLFPDFSLPAAILQADGSVLQTTMGRDDFRGRALVLFVYPKNATSGCSIEACAFRDAFPEFEKRNTTIAGLSRDTVRAHGRWIEKEQFPFPLLADAEQTYLKAWNLIVAKTMYGKPVTKVQRTTFLLDENSILRQVWHDVTPLGHAREVLNALS